MTTVCPYFQLHQPKRLRRYSVFDAGTAYFDDNRNKQILRRVATKCYLPAVQTLTRQIEATDGAFRCSLSITGCLLEQLEAWAPEVIDAMVALTQTGGMEWLGETSHHSLAFLYHRDEFASQVQAHRQRIEQLFGQTPKVFRNTELIYLNDLAQWLAQDGSWRGVLAEGVDQVLQNNAASHSPNHPYNAPGLPDMGVLLRNYRLSDDIAFRFHCGGPAGGPLDAVSYAKRLVEMAKPQAALTATPASDASEAKSGTQTEPLPPRAADVLNLFMDFETFGEHHWSETGILRFLDALPQTAINEGLAFGTCSDVLESVSPIGDYACPTVTSWADQERDASAWVGNAMQSSAHAELYKVGNTILASQDADLIDDWRNLTVSDHFYYMSTKSFGDGQVHAYFNPYESPYDAYINFMNVVDHLQARVDAIGG